jgi:hypothetical protein
MKQSCLTLFLCGQTLISFLKKSEIPSSVNVEHNGTAINLHDYALKAVSARDVHDEYTTVCGRAAIAYLTVCKYIYASRNLPQFLSIPEEPSTIVVNQAILGALERRPCSYV